MSEIWRKSADVPPPAAPPVAPRQVAAEPARPAAAPQPQPTAPRPVPAAPARAPQLQTQPQPQPAQQAVRPAAAQPSIKLGHTVAVSGPITTIALAPETAATSPRAEIGSLVKIRSRAAHVMGIIASLKELADRPGAGKILVEVVLVGELADNGPNRSFTRGVTHFPCIGDEAFCATHQDHTLVYGHDGHTTIDVGTLYQDPAIPARLLAEELFSKHFAIVGTTGCGKSSALTGIIHRALEGHQYAHVLVLDMHGEYQQAFGPRAEVISAGNLLLPFWLLNFQELRSVLTSPDDHYDAQSEILCDAIVHAKKRYGDAAAGRVRSRVFESASGTVDTPTPFRLSDLTGYIDEQLGKLERPYPTLAYRRLKLRIEALAIDPRFSFMFGNPNMEDNMVDILGQLFRIPNDGRPVTVVELSTVPEEILDVVILLLSRLTFDLAVWSDGALPVLLVCEEAHRYAPADERKGYLPTKQALSRIAKEGRKYGLSLALLTQRPSELETTILSQCSTIVAMRLSTETDQKVMRANVHDSTFGVLEYLPLLADREAIVIGCGAPMPMRIKFRSLPDACLPGLGQRKFVERWNRPNMDRRQLEETVARWRGIAHRRG